MSGVSKPSGFDVTCQGTVPTALICAFESTSLEDAVRNAVSLGGDTDTLAAIAGAVGEVMHGLPEGLVRTARETLPARRRGHHGNGALPPSEA
ncbi:MAG: ADP-ribosylglycohydrolase family protein [Chromatiales bacterium]|nr:ADP-ribosylglycohydrolase family protein [Chromatiales bacterium]